MRKERVNEIWGVFSLLLGLFTAASLIFFQRDDVAFYRSPLHDDLTNPTGIIGTYLAHGLTLTFGLASYLIPCLFLVWSWCFFNQKLPERKLFKLAGLFVGLVSAAVFLGISFYPEKRFLRAGAVGYTLGTHLLQYFGTVGSYIIATACFFLSVLLATDFLIYPFFRSLGENLLSFFANAAGAFERMKLFWEGFIGKFTPFIAKREAVTQALKTLKGRANAPVAAVRLPADPIIKTQKPLESVREEKLVAAVEEIIPRKHDAERAAAGSLIKVESSGKQSEPILTKPESSFQLPSPDLLRKPELKAVHTENLKLNSQIIEETLREFGLEGRVVEVEQGPVITRYELLPAPGVKVNKVLGLSDDLALALKATSLRFIAPIPGKSAIGIEVPNTRGSVVFFRELIESKDFINGGMALPLVLGKDTSGKPLIADLAQMPHLLIAGTTGSGKTVCVNAIIAGLLYSVTPDKLKFVMVDPKMVELANYGTLPHMLAPVVTDPKKAAATLNWVLTEMENRYRLFATRGVRNIAGFNSQSEESIPYIVVIIDELADLMMVAQDKVEAAITRLAQLSRAVGIHLILATQRPSVDVITGVIKANFPARISFKVASKVDSRTVLDLNGADQLVGKGDLLFLKPGEAKLIRGQGAFVRDEEIADIVQFVSSQRAPDYHPEIQSLNEEKSTGSTQDKDDLFEEAVRIVFETGIASASTLQRRLRLGYTRAARIVDQMEADGIVGPHNGSKPREILVVREQTLRKTTVQA